MSTAPGAESRTCPTCGATNPARQLRCWLCHEPLAGVSLSQPTVAPEQIVEKGTRWDLIVWWVILGVVAVICVGLAAEKPGLGIGLAVLATPVLARVLVTMLRRQGQGLPMTSGRVAGTLAVSLGVVMAMGVAAALAFGATCAVTGFGAVALDQIVEVPVVNERLIIIGWNVISGLVGILAAYGVYRGLRR